MTDATFGVPLTIALLAISLGLDAFSVAVGIGLRGAGRQEKLLVPASFAAFQVGMPVLGLLAGLVLSEAFQDLTAYAGFALLTGLGLHTLWEARSGRKSADESPGARDRLDLARGWGLVLASVSVSLDALGAGFSLAVLNLPVAVTLASIGAVAYVLTFAGLQFGRALGARIEQRSEQAAGLLLTGLGIYFIIRRALG